MAFQIPQNEQEKYQYVQQKFSDIAQKYDLFNDIVTQGLHRYWKNFVIKKAQVKPGDQALDICCGTGDITQRLERKIGPTGKVLGLDFSEGMLKVAESRKTPQDLRQFLQGDAMKLPFADNSFDAVTVGYGLRNLVRITDCFDEVLRVLKPGGRFVSLDMGKVNVPVAKQIFGFYFFKVVPVIGKALYPGEDMFEYFPESSVKYPGQKELKALLEQRGFEQVSYYNFHLGATAVHVSHKPK